MRKIKREKWQPDLAVWQGGPATNSGKSVSYLALTFSLRLGFNGQVATKIYKLIQNPGRLPET